MLPSLLLSVVSQDGIESAFAIGFGCNAGGRRTAVAA